MFTFLVKQGYVLPDVLIRRACTKICEPYVLSNACRSSRTNSYRHYTEISRRSALTCTIQFDRKRVHGIREKSLNCGYKFHTNTPLRASDNQKNERRDANILIGLTLFCLCFLLWGSVVCTDGEFDKPGLQ